MLFVNAGVFSLLTLIPDHLGEKYMYANIVGAHLQYVVVLN